jgi:argininosuccinate lyase
MPQKRNPVALEHARALASKAAGQAAAIGSIVHNTPFGDIVDTEDDLQPLVASAFRDAVRAATLVAAALRGAELDVARLEARAAEGGTTLTELADHLARAHRLPFTTAHAIAAKLHQVRRERPDAPLGAVLSTVSSDLLGVPLQYSDAQIARIMSPRHFVEVRKTPGGPAPAETARALQVSRERLTVDGRWLQGKREAIARATEELNTRSAAV